MTTISDALKEAYAVASTNLVILDTVELYHPSANNGIPRYLVADRVEQLLGLDSSDNYFITGTDSIEGITLYGDADTAPLNDGSARILLPDGTANGKRKWSNALITLQWSVTAWQILIGVNPTYTSTGDQTTPFTATWPAATGSIYPCVTFSPIGFQFSPPEVGDNGAQELTLKIDNINREASDFVDAVVGSVTPVEAIYRPYLSTDKGIPQMSPPLRLYVREATVTPFGVQAKASFADIINKAFLTEIFHADRFPNLAYA